MSDVASLEELSPGSAPASYRFQLFVTGDSVLSVRAKEHVARHLTGPLGNRAEVEVIDLIADPIVARRERIVATPTLVRLEPAPVVRLIGDLTNFDRVRSLVLVGEDYLSPAERSPTAHTSADGPDARQPNARQPNAGAQPPAAGSSLS